MQTLRRQTDDAVIGGLHLLPNFLIPARWRGRFLNRLGGRAHDSVADSLERLKRAAEARALQAEIGKVDDGAAQAFGGQLLN